MQPSLQDILFEKKKELDGRQKQKNKWIKTIKKLYKPISKWMKPLEQQKYINISYIDILISEELFGDYTVQKMIITFFNNQKIELTPIGLDVIGATGRIDMVVGDRIIMIIDIFEHTNWFFAERKERGKPKRWKFNENNFNKILTEYVKAF